MRLRTGLSVANLVAIALAFFVLFALPQYSTFAFYALVAWMFVGFGMMYLPGARRPVAPSPVAAGAGPFPSSAPGPLPSSGDASVASPPLDFCIWCGTNLGPGVPACPSCGRRVAPV